MTPLPLKLRRPDNPDRNAALSRDHFDVIAPDGKVVGRIFKPGGGSVDWMWCLSAAVRLPLRNHGYADTLEEVCAAFRAAWEAARRSDPAPKIVPKLTHRPSRASSRLLCQF